MTLEEKEAIEEMISEQEKLSRYGLEIYSVQKMPELIHQLENLFDWDDFPEMLDLCEQLEEAQTKAERKLKVALGY